MWSSLQHLEKVHYVLYSPLHLLNQNKCFKLVFGSLLLNNMNFLSNTTLKAAPNKGRGSLTKTSLALAGG